MVEAVTTMCDMIETTTIEKAIIATMTTTEPTEEVGHMTTTIDQVVEVGPEVKADKITETTISATAEHTKTVDSNRAYS